MVRHLTNKNRKKRKKRKLFKKVKKAAYVLQEILHTALKLAEIVYAIYTLHNH